MNMNLTGGLRAPSPRAWRTLSFQFSVLSSRRARFSGTALIETAIVMPLYMLLLMGLIYFGYATLSRQRQNVAGAAASWLQGPQRADLLLAEFWPSAGQPSGAVTGDTSEARAGDMRLVATERVREGDEYYGDPEAVPSQLPSPHSLGSGGETFDIERVAVSLWTYALGEVHQYIEWVPGQGAVPRTVMRYDHMADYLNYDSRSGRAMGGAFVHADENTLPEIDDYALWITSAYDGLSGPWLERRSTRISATYRPPFFGQIYSETGSEESTFSQYVTGAYAEPEYLPTAAGAFDLTGRGFGMRRAAREFGMTSEELLAEGRDFIGDGDPLPPADAMDTVQAGFGTFTQLWQSR